MPHRVSVIYQQEEKAALGFVAVLKVLLKLHLMTNQLRFRFYSICIVSLRYHCTELKCCMDLKFDSGVCLLKDLTLVIYIYMD